MPDTHRLAITATGVGTAEVLLNGQDIANALTGLTLDMGVGKVPTATLDLLLIDTTKVQDAETRIFIPDATREALLALGWTPPTEPEPTDHLRVTPYLVVYRYHDGVWAWMWRCDGDGTCEGHTALDFTNRKHAEANARDHLAAEHPATAATKEG
jgi:hypothetical protein